MNNDTPADATLTSGRDILAENFDQIRLAFDSLKRDRDRLKDVIVSLRVNAIKSDEPEALLAFMRDGLGGVDEGLTIGEMVSAYKPVGNARTAKPCSCGSIKPRNHAGICPHCGIDGPAPSLMPQDGLVDALRKFMPTNINLDNKNVSNKAVIPLDVTMGELRAIAAALASIEVKP